MLTLSLLRHAKSSRDDASLDDHDRPLAARGREAAPRMGAWMAANGLRPDLVLCSTAARARETADLVRAAFPAPPRMLVERNLYLAEPEAMLARVQRVGAAVRHVLLVAHNPGLHELAGLLAGTGEVADLAALAEGFPTAALAVLDLDAERWRDWRFGAAHLRLLATPKRLPD